MSFHVSPLLIGSGIAAAATTILLAIMWYLDSNPGPRPIPGPGQMPPPPPPSHGALLISIGLFTIAWVAVVAALCRDQIVRQINTAAQQITTATLECGELRDTEGYLRALNVTLSDQPPSRASDAPAGGDVLPFPRQPDNREPDPH